jgi:hypothetical protein
VTPPGADAEDRWVRRHRLLVVLARVTLPVTGILVSTGTYSGSPAVAALVAGVVGALAVVFRLRGQEPPTVDGARTAYVLRTHRAPPTTGAQRPRTGRRTAGSHAATGPACSPSPSSRLRRPSPACWRPTGPTRPASGGPDRS